MGWRARMVRLKMLWQGRFRRWGDSNLRALARLRPRLTAENRAILDSFAESRNRWLLPRLVGFKRCGIYRQTLLGNLGLVAAAIFNKI
jgi:hypothetical protein